MTLKNKVLSNVANGKYINKSGTIKWFKNGYPHRVNGPATIYPDGEEHWYQDGYFNRDHGPSSIYPEGEMRWYHGRHLLSIAIFT